MKKFWFSVIINLLFCFTVCSQVEHNFPVSPEKTDCHKLLLTEDDVTNIELIKNTTFRLKEELQISRYQIPNSITFYWCEGDKGYALVQEKENQFRLFKSINKTLWDSLNISDDPIDFYQQYFKNE